MYTQREIFGHTICGIIMERCEMLENLFLSQKQVNLLIAIDALFAAIKCHYI